MTIFLASLLDSLHPTIFELAMVQQLEKAQRPAFDFLAQILAERYPQLFNILTWRDEIYLVVNGMIQRHYLNLCSGSFAENFYGIKRMKLDSNGNFQKLCASERFVSWLSISILPFIIHKMATSGKRLESLATDQDTKSLISRVFDKSIKSAYMMYHLLALYMQLGYMFGKSKFYSPILWIQGVVLDRLNGDDMREQMMKKDAQYQNGNVLSKILSHSLTVLRGGLLVSALLFKIAEMYYSPENQGQREQMNGGLGVIPPPMEPKPCPTAFGVRLPSNTALCPLCNEPRRNPAISSSGILYCNICIQKFVAEHQHDPVTGSPCAPCEIRRIFVN